MILKRDASEVESREVSTGVGALVEDTVEEVKGEVARKGKGNRCG